MIPNVLIVDDNAGVRSMLTEAFGCVRDRFTVIFAENGQEALSVLARESIDLVVTDLMMPVMDGFELLTVMMEKYPGVQRIVMSSSESAVMKLHQEVTGFEAFLVKPINPKLLEKRILQALNARDETGFLRGISLPSFVQLIDLEQKTCTVHVRNPADDQEALLYFAKGQMLDVHLGARVGLEPAYEVLGWKNIQISIHNDCPPVTDNIRMPIHTVLLEAACRRDREAAGMSSVEDSPADGLDLTKDTFVAAPRVSADSASAAANTGTVKSSVKSLREMLASETVDLVTTRASEPLASARPEDLTPIASEAESKGRKVRKGGMDEVVEFDADRLGGFLVERPGVSHSPAGRVSAASPKAPSALPVVVDPRSGDGFNELMEEGIDAFRRAEFQVAKELWERARLIRPDDGRVQYNLKLVSKKLLNK